MLDRTIKLAALDALDLPLLLLDERCRPVFLSAPAARLLEVHNRYSLDEHETLLHPLIECARADQKRSGKKPFQADEQTPPKTLVVNLTNSRPLSLLAYSRLLPLETEDGTGERAHVVLFYPLDTLHPLLQVLEQARKTRAFSVLTASTADSQGDLPESGSIGVDLSKVITASIHIVDQMIVSSTKLVLDVKTSALVSGSQGELTRAVSHLLLDAADFVGPGGVVKVRLSLAARERKPVVEESRAEIVILAERANTPRQHLGPFEQYLQSLCAPQSYRVSVREGAGDGRETKDLPLRGFLSAAKSERLHSLNEVSFDGLSDNLRIAHSLAEKNGGEVLIRPLQHNLLTLLLQLPLNV